MKKTKKHQPPLDGVSGPVQHVPGILDMDDCPESQFMRQAHELNERIKEINCLYGISKIVEKDDISLEEIYQEVIRLIPCSWQYPDITCARCIIHGKTYQTDNYQDTCWKQSADIIAYRDVIGVISVCYLEKTPDSHEGPFLKEERSLINAIAERLGRTSEQKQAEKALFESEQQLKNQNQLLKEKNIALREIMNQVITEKKNLEERVMENVDQFLLPLVDKLKNSGSQIDIGYLNLLEDTLKQLTSAFGSKMARNMPKLTPRENEICNMIRSGLSSKEIARILNISHRSVETYRNYIRKKLGIINQKINLASYLSTLK
ncbi:regulatory protein, luxR family [Desulfocicer vacuolatum DSM 3385]|uniref:Regulatory protein, luxR family n=1 Tax=Desulfocicer vacuolatum DSM 3385 TaxID=1121400 RepID=A0A1W2ED47_9BACT|nr:helix-turn-helix transcriptional regulator [Desulfocicer vacuolatum]SMD07663.1 regulatory protein, luxR family [Desulfocicer vacuolatum DSM 3385]